MADILMSFAPADDAAARVHGALAPDPPRVDETSFADPQPRPEKFAPADPDVWDPPPPRDCREPPAELDDAQLGDQVGGTR